MLQKSLRKSYKLFLTLSNLEIYMSALPLLVRSVESEIDYPDSDGQQMADNTLQYDWITMIVDNLKDLYHDDPNVFVAGDLLWYPVQGHREINKAPDALVVFGRPKGPRGSYKQWEEGDIAPHCVFEILSPCNTTKEMAEKLRFYNRYGVAEYYLYDPHAGTLQGWRRSRLGLQPILQMNGWTSPRLGIRFESNQNRELILYRPNGQRFSSYLEQAQRAANETQRATAEAQRATVAEQLKQKAEQRAQAAEAELSRLKALLEQLQPK